MQPTSIGDALFTKTQQRVLGLLYGQPDKSFYTNKIVRWADMGRGTVRRELERLVSADLLLKTREGNQLHYQANPEGPIFVELINVLEKISAQDSRNVTVGIIRMDDLVENNRENILALAKENGVCNVRVFGSIARDAANPDSDLDLLVDIENGKSGLALGGFLSDVSDLLRRKVDVATEKSLHPKIREKVLHEAIAL